MTPAQRDPDVRRPADVVLARVQDPREYEDSDDEVRLLVSRLSYLV